MSSENKRDLIIQQLIKISGMLKEGRYEEIDLSLIEKEANDLAYNLKELIINLENAGNSLTESYSVSQISDNLNYICKTTAEGVSRVIDQSESIINRSTQIAADIDKLKAKFPVIGEEESFKKIKSELSELQNNAFTIMTSLEFEDINRQLIEKISKKLNELYENLMKVLFLLKFKEKQEQSKEFLNELKKVADVNMENSHKQDVIDQLLKEFGL